MATITLFFEDLYSNSQDKPILSDIWQDWFQQWLNLLSPDTPQNDHYELTLRLTNDEEIKALNNQFRNIDKTTDVLSFASLENEILIDDLDEPIYLGDIIISVETAKRQAITQQHALKIELTWLASHGFLHLLGWNHPDDQSLVEMLKQQENLLEEINLITIK
jgi:probable rRNA maturation factor